MELKPFRKEIWLWTPASMLCHEPLFLQHVWSASCVGSWSTSHCVKQVSTHRGYQRAFSHPCPTEALPQAHLLQLEWSMQLYYPSGLQRKQTTRVCRLEGVWEEHMLAVPGPTHGVDLLRERLDKKIKAGKIQARRGENRKCWDSFMQSPACKLGRHGLQDQANISQPLFF